MKVIFLDNDGVVCLAQQWGTRFSKQRKAKNEEEKALIKNNLDNLDRKAVIVLNSILEETGAEYVISSDWKKHATLEELGDYYISQGLIKKPIDFTPRFKEIEKDVTFNAWRRDEYLEQERSFEIQAWLKAHPEVEEWVAIDDMHLGYVANFGYGELERVWGLTNFVWTPDSNQGIKQTGIKEKILNFLK